MWKGLSIFFILNLASAICPALYAKDCVWVESSGSAYLSNITPEQAREMAKREARGLAIANVAGVEVKAQTIVKDLSLQADLIKTMSEGVILEEKEIKWEKKDDPDHPGNMLLTLHYKACVKKLEGERDPYFKVTLEMDANTFVEGDESVLRVSCTKDCYITIFNITADNQVLVLYPDGRYFKENFLKKGEVFEFPPKRLRDLGLKLKVRLLEGQKENTEIMEVVAVKKKLNFARLLCKKKAGRGFCQENGAGEDIELLDLLSLLSEIPLNERSEDVAVYLVKKR